MNETILCMKIFQEESLLITPPCYFIFYSRMNVFVCYTEILSLSEWWIYEATRIGSLGKIDPVVSGLNPGIIHCTCTFIHIHKTIHFGL